MGGHSLPPGQLCGGWPPKGPIHHPGGHTKTSLSSTGVGHQREGRSGRAREEGGKAGRKEEDRRKQNGEEEEPRDLAHMPVPGSGNRDYACLSPRQTTACHQTSPLLQSVVLAFKPPPAQGKGEEPRPPAHRGVPDDLVSKPNAQPGWHMCLH